MDISLSLDGDRGKTVRTENFDLLYDGIQHEDKRRKGGRTQGNLFDSLEAQAQKGIPIMVSPPYALEDRGCFASTKSFL